MGLLPPAKCSGEGLHVDCVVVMLVDHIEGRPQIRRITLIKTEKSAHDYKTRSGIANMLILCCHIKQILPISRASHLNPSQVYGWPSGADLPLIEVTFLRKAPMGDLSCVLLAQTSSKHL